MLLCSLYSSGIMNMDEATFGQFLLASTFAYLSRLTIGTVQCKLDVIEVLKID